MRFKMAKNLSFYDVRKRKKFSTTNYRLRSKRTPKGMRYFAIANAPSGGDSYRLISKETYNQLKK